MIVCFIAILVLVALFLMTMLFREWVEIISDFMNRRR